MVKREQKKVFIDDESHRFGRHGLPPVIAVASEDHDAPVCSWEEGFQHLSFMVLFWIVMLELCAIAGML